MCKVYTPGVRAPTQLKVSLFAVLVLILAPPQTLEAAPTCPLLAATLAPRMAAAERTPLCPLLDGSHMLQLARAAVGVAAPPTTAVDSETGAEPPKPRANLMSAGERGCSAPVAGGGARGIGGGGTEHSTALATLGTAAMAAAMAA